MSNIIIKIIDNIMKIKIDCSHNGTYVVIVKPKSLIKMHINTKHGARTDFELTNKINYGFIREINKNKGLEIEIIKFYGQPFTAFTQALENIEVLEYGKPIYDKNYKYQILYSFDSNYLSGGFASIWSLLSNYNEKKLSKTNINICTPESDFDIINKDLGKFINITNKYVDMNNYTLFFTNHFLVDDVFINTKCYKGGNHLLKLSNFSRLIASYLVESDRILYIDADTIVQSDISKCLDRVPKVNPCAFIGKKSTLNYNNLINVNNKSRALEFLGGDFDLSRNVIYTGTVIINSKTVRRNFHNIVRLVKMHNNTPNGIYKLFTMSIMNLGMSEFIGYFDDYLTNVVDLGYKKGLENENDTADVLDWSGMFKPWFVNGLYKEYWIKYNIMYDNYDKYVMYNKSTIESKMT